MKYILTIFLGACLLVKGYSQVYHPIPMDSVSWYEKREGSNPGCYYYFYDYIFPAGQVIIDGNLFTKLLCNENFILNVPAPGWCQPGQQYSNMLYGFMRNDSINKLVYWYDSIYYHEELILYDFNVSVGDTINPNPAMFGNNPNDTIIVTSLDSVDIGGAYRRSYTISSIFPGGFKDTIIEGIGSKKSLFYGCDKLGIYYFSDCQLICYQFKGYQYPGTVGLDCTFHIGLEESISTSNEIIHLVGENLYYVMNDENHSININCYDMLGKLVMKKMVNGSDYLDFSHLSSGYYLMYLEYDGQPVKPLKFMVQH